MNSLCRFGLIIGAASWIACAPGAEDTSASGARTPRRASPGDRLIEDTTPTGQQPNRRPAPSAPSDDSDDSDDSDVGAGNTDPSPEAEDTPEPEPSPLPPPHADEIDATHVTSVFDLTDDLRSIGCLRPDLGHGWQCEDVKVDGSVTGAFGSKKARAPQYAISAPHGQFDWFVENIVATVLEATAQGRPILEQWNGVIGWNARNREPFPNINRPTVFEKDSCETPNSVAAGIYKRFRTLLKTNPYKLYVEIHGYPDSSTVQIATSRVSAEQAKKIKAVMGEEAKRMNLSVIVKIEPLDKISRTASQAKLCGAIHDLAPAPALHIELPQDGILSTDENVLATSKMITSTLARIATDVFSAGSL